MYSKSIVIASMYDVSYNFKDRCTADQKNLDGGGVW